MVRLGYVRAFLRSLKERFLPRTPFLDF